jgi:hypothetical protein
MKCKAEAGMTRDREEAQFKAHQVSVCLDKRKGTEEYEMPAQE